MGRWWDASLLGILGKESFESSDEQDVAGYAYVMGSVQTAWANLRISESILLQLHRDLLRYSDKDERNRNRGQWKSLGNHVAAFDAAEALDANRNTFKDKFGELVERGYAELRGKGRGAHYRRVTK